uniref:Candidate secreted effector n=1 Tax=Meloidogyne incognita TaxID=6306 RepID=A0A914LD28_MELIC
MDTTRSSSISHLLPTSTTCAFSQLFTRLSPRKTVFTLKSIPTVETNAEVNESSQ